MNLIIYVHINISQSTTFFAIDCRSLSSLFQNLNKCGIVTHIDHGTATVDFDGTSWDLNSAAVVRESSSDSSSDDDELDDEIKEIESKIDENGKNEHVLI